MEEVHFISPGKAIQPNPLFSNPVFILGRVE
jgi:hypothetical protein